MTPRLKLGRTPAPRRPYFRPTLVELEPRLTPNDLLGSLQSALLAPALVAPAVDSTADTTAPAAATTPASTTASTTSAVADDAPEESSGPTVLAGPASLPAPARLESAPLDPGAVVGSTASAPAPTLLPNHGPITGSSTTDFTGAPATGLDGNQLFGTTLPTGGKPSVETASASSASSSSGEASAPLPGGGGGDGLSQHPPAAATGSSGTAAAPAPALTLPAPAPLAAPAPSPSVSLSLPPSLTTAAPDVPPTQATPKLSLGSNARVVFFGDSITQFGSLPGGYVSLMQQALQNNYPNANATVINAGVAGNTVPDLQARVDQDVIAQHPSLVFIEIGVNDVWRYETMAATGGTPAAQYAAGLAQMIGKIEQAGAQVVLCTPPVIGEKLDGENFNDARLDQYANLSRQVAAMTGATVCDLHQAFQSAETVLNTGDVSSGVLTIDGVHPNALGNQLIAEQMLNLLQA